MRCETGVAGLLGWYAPKAIWTLWAAEAPAWVGAIIGIHMHPYQRQMDENCEEEWCYCCYYPTEETEAHSAGSWPDARYD